MAAKARILAIDDQLYFRSFIEGLLSEEGYEVATTDSGPAALELLQRDGPYDLVITDLVMPGMDGVETVSRICESWPDQTVIVVSGVGDVRAAVAAMKLGAADYLLKPIDREGLIRAIESVLERGRMRTENARLVDENLAYMNQISLFERVVPLLSLRRPADVAEQLLVLLCGETGARGGMLWLRDPERRDYESFVAHGLVDLPSERVRWDGDSEALRRALASGGAEVSASPGEDGEGGHGGSETLYVPCSREGVLVCVAQLSGRGSEPISPAVSGACARIAELGALALEIAREKDRLEAFAMRDSRTGLPSPRFLADVARTETRRAQRFGRLLSVVSIALAPEKEDASPDAASLAGLPECLRHSIRGADLLASEGLLRYWVLVCDASPLGALVLKRRLAAEVAGFLGERPLALSARVGVATFPADGETYDDLAASAALRGRAAETSLVQTLGIATETPLAELTDRLLAQGTTLPAQVVPQTADLLLGELVLRPGDRGLLFLAPGCAALGSFAFLSRLGQIRSATDVFLATDGETLPVGAQVSSLPLPHDLPPETTLVLRYGEAPPYAMLAGAADETGGTRTVFHSSDSLLVEHLAFRLREEAGLGVRP